MKPFRKNVAIAVDGGGLRGLIVTKALTVLEEELGISLHDTFGIAAGTSTGSIISAAIGMDISAAQMTEMYTELGPAIFPRNWRKIVFPLSRYRYPEEPLRDTLKKYLGNHIMGDFWTHTPPIDVIITTFDLVTNHTLFIKPWKAEYASWSVAHAVQCSCTVPTYFPVVEGRYVDGGVGSYANPCYLAAYEAKIILGWKPEETTLISLGTGRDPHTFTPSKTSQMWAWQWLDPLLGAFMQSADDQQVHLVKTFFEDLDFRRFQIDLREPIKMDDPTKIPELIAYGARLGRMILNDNIDPAQNIVPEMPGG